MKLGPIRARQVRAGPSSIRKQSEYAYVFHYLRRFQQTEEIAGGKDLTAKHHAGRKGKGTPVLTRRLERRIDNHLPVRNKIVERPQGILNFVLSGRANA